jgi:hypothetical protein
MMMGDGGDNADDDNYADDFVTLIMVNWVRI